MAKFVLHCAVRSSLNRNGDKQDTLKQQQHQQKEEEQRDPHSIESAAATTKTTTNNLRFYCCCINCNSSKPSSPFATTANSIVTEKKEKANVGLKGAHLVEEAEPESEETINFWSSSIAATECNCLNCIQENFQFKFHSIESFFNTKHRARLGNLSSSTQVSLSLDRQKDSSSSSSSSSSSQSSLLLLNECHSRSLGALQQKLLPIYYNNNNDQHSHDDLIVSPKYLLRSLQPIYGNNFVEVRTTKTTTATTSVITANSNISTNAITKHLIMNEEGRQQQQQQQQQQQSQGTNTTTKRSENMMLKNMNGTTTNSATATNNNNNNNSNLRTNYNNNGFIRNGTIMTAINNEKREHLYKILVIGELGTGKTSYIKRYVHQFFSQNYRATIGVDFALKVLHWDSNTVVRLQLWDIAGQERFGNMTRVYYKEAVGAFIVFDVTRSGTFECVSKWKEDLDSKVQLPDGTPIPCILLANKCDQEKQGTVANAEKMDEYVRENGFSGWFETSAKENINIDEAARALVNKILLNDKLISSSDLNDGEKFNLNTTDNQNVQDDKSKCSC